MSKPIIAGTILAIGLLPFASVHALDFSNATGADIVKENASKDRGYSSAQLAEIREKLAGRELTFHDGKVLSVGKSYDGNISISVRFEVPGADILTPAFTVSGKVSDATMAKIALALDEKAEIKSLTGRVAKGGFGFSLEDAKFVPAVMPSLEAEYDPATITGDEIVKFNASKKGGLSSAKMKKLTEDVAGRELTFHDGKVLSVGKSYDGNISISVRFEVPGADILTPAFTVSGKATDAAMAKIALALDEKAEIKSLTGRVAKGGFGFSLEDAKFVPAVMPSLEAEYDPATITGDEIVKFNASKKGGLSSAKMKKLTEDVDGRELTFHDGKVLSVGKSYDGNISISVRFEVPGADILTPAFTVSGKVSDAAMAKIALALDEKAEIKSLTGRVAKGGFGFSLEDAKFVPAEMPSLEAEYDPATITGDEIVKFNASKKGGLSSAKMKKLTEDLAGRELTFHDGKVLSVGKSYDGNISISVRFEVPGADILTPAFTVSGKVTEETMKERVRNLDEGTKVECLAGKVGRSGLGIFSLENVKVVVR